MCVKSKKRYKLPLSETHPHLMKEWDFKRFDKLKAAGYDIVFIWENDYREGKEASIWHKS